MSTNTLMRAESKFPTLFDDFFKPFNELFDNNRLWNRMPTVPAVNISENKEAYKLTLAAPGLTRDDFRIDVENNMLTLSAEKEEKEEEKDEKFTRKEYSYTSFSRSFNIPEDVKAENIEAKYTDGILTLVMPKKEEARRKSEPRHINVN